MELIRERDYYHCRYCSSYYFPDDSPDGVRILGENQDGLNCPLCRIPLKIAIFDDFYRGYHCGECQGILFNRTAFRKTIEHRRARATRPAEPPARYQAEELERHVLCPDCSQTMSNHRYLGPGNIIIDTCDTCDLIWLDFGELSKVVEAPGKDRGEWQKGIKELHAGKSRPVRKEPQRSAFAKFLLKLMEDLTSQ